LASLANFYAEEVGQKKETEGSESVKVNLGDAADVVVEVGGKVSVELATYGHSCTGGGGNGHWSVVQ
jgi:hypothetical protein